MMRLVAGAVLAAALADSVVAVHAAAPALASASPKVQAGATSSGWSGMTRRPGTIYVGQGGSPIVYKLTWHSWGSSSAQATGKLAKWGKNCLPIVSCKPTVYKVTVTLTDVKNHNGTLSYRKMADADTGAHR
jgi:hypothetical protein